MSRITYIIVLGVGVLAVLLFLAVRRPGKQVSEPPQIQLKQSSSPSGIAGHATAAPTIQNRDHELSARREPAVDLRGGGLDLTPFMQETEDSALIQLWANYKPKQIGRVTQKGVGDSVLELDDGRTFNAVHIGEHRSQAIDGTVALEAITKPGGVPMKTIEAKEGGVTTTGEPSEVWVIGLAGKRERVSPDNMHAVWPEISPDGRYVAFTAQYLVGGALYPKVLIIKDRTTGELTSYAERKHGADYEIAALDWVDGGKVLRVVEDWGETGGHTQLKQVRVK